MSRILSSDSSSKYSLSHSSKSVLTVSGLQFTTTVLLPSWRSVRILETAHQSNSTLLPARRQKSGQGKEGCREENIKRRSHHSSLKKKTKGQHCLLSAQSQKCNCPPMEINHPQNGNLQAQQVSWLSCSGVTDLYNVCHPVLINTSVGSCCSSNHCCLPTNALCDKLKSGVN